MTDLSPIIEKLEAAEGPDREIDAAIALQVAGWTFERRGAERKAWWRAPRQSWTSSYSNRPPQFSKSIDAALSLVEQKLPGWSGEVGFGKSADADGEFGCCLEKLEPPINGVLAYAATPALALCLALLKALQARGEA